MIDSDRYQHLDGRDHRDDGNAATGISWALLLSCAIYLLIVVTIALIGGHL